MTTQVPEPEPPEPEEIDGDDDIAAFAEEYDGLRADVAAMKQKIAGIPDDIGAKLDALLKGQGIGKSTTSQPRATSRGGASPRPQGSGAAGASQGESQPTENAGVSEPEKKPQAQHWYYRDFFWPRR